MTAQASYGDETAVLFAELNHRFFNSFQVISGLAARCGRVKCTSELQPILDDLDSRIAAFATVHRLLAFPPDRQCVEDRCRSLCANLLRAFGRTDTVAFAFEDVALSPVQVERLPILVVEMVTNVLKHGRSAWNAGRITVAMTADPDAIELCVSDGGATPYPLPAPRPSRTVEALALTLQGSAFVADREGYVACVRMPREQVSRQKPRLSVASAGRIVDVAA